MGRNTPPGRFVRLLLLVCVVAALGLLSRTVVYDPRGEPIRTAARPTPAAELEQPTPTPEPAATATAFISPLPTIAVQSTPVLLGEDGSAANIQRETAPIMTQAPVVDITQKPVEATLPPITPTPTPPVEVTPTEAPAPQTITMAADATPSPAPGPTPTYEWEANGARIEVTKHEIKNVVYFAAEIWLSDVSQLRSAFSGDRFDAAAERLTDIADRNGAKLAINGDYATFNDGGIIIRNGELYRDNRSTRHLLVIDGNGDFIPYTEPPQESETAAAQFVADGVWQTLVFGPVLVANGEAVPLPSKYFINTSGALEPRTAIAQLGPLHYLILVVDGRQKGYSQGVSLERLQELFLQHGAQTAFNLDGGGSTTLYYDGEIINKPANGGQRHVPDILFIGK